MIISKIILCAPYNKSANANMDKQNRVAISKQPSINIENFKFPSNISFRSAMREHIGQGARYLGDNKTKFTLTSSYADKVSVKIIDEKSDFTKARIEYLDKMPDGKYSKIIENTKPGDKYIYQITKNDGSIKELYDPRADYLPYDILDYTPKSNYAEIIDHSKYKWTDAKWMNSRVSSNNKHSGWGIPQDTIIEVLHIGVLGGFKNAKNELDKIAEAGIANAVRIMPVGEFYGKNNWGYDESAKFAVENSYGTPDEFKDFVNHAHEKGIKVIVDAILNHFGPYGSNIHEYMSAFQEDKNTPWGKTLDFQGKDGKKMASYMTDMLMNWAVNYHVDGFRLDATHCIYPNSVVQDIMKELRSHNETKDLIIFPEDMRISRVMANSNLPKQISEQNWGYNGQTTFDFYKSLLSNVTKNRIYNIYPNAYQFEQIFKNVILDSHEDCVLRDNNADQTYKKLCQNNLSLPKQNADNFIISVSNADEIGNDAGGKRNILNILASRLNLYYRFEGDWRNAQRFIFDMIKNYTKNGSCLDEETQKLYGCKIPIDNELFLRELKKSFDLNKLILGTMLMHPSPKEFFMGDERGELAPFKFFCEMPKNEIADKEALTEQKGYAPDEKAFDESKIGQKEYSLDWIQEGTYKFFTDFADILKKLPVFKTCELNKMATYSYPDKEILEVKRYDDNNNEVIAVINFSDIPRHNFELNTTIRQELKEILNSNSLKYNGNGRYENGEHQSSKSITIPPRGIVVFIPQKDA